MTSTPIADFISTLMRHGLPNDVIIQIARQYEAAIWANLNREPDPVYVRRLEYDRQRKSLLRASLPPGRSWNDVKTEVFERDGYICRYCDADTPEPHCDHFVPLSRGGQSTPDNLLTACPPCNMDKAAQLFAEWKGLTQ